MPALFLTAEVVRRSTEAIAVNGTPFEASSRKVRKSSEDHSLRRLRLA